MKILYFDCFSGISGDMTLASLIDAGADRDYITEQLKKLPFEPYTLEWKRVLKTGVSALKMNVKLDENHPPEHHRHYNTIVEAIKSAGFNDRVVDLSLKMFAAIGVAEGKIHDVSLEKVHFHEVGAIDSIVDIVGVALAIDQLDVDKIVSKPIPLGHGTVHCDHGLYPVPAPATLEILKGIPIAHSDLRYELTTPTGAAIVATMAGEYSNSIPAMKIETIGYGAGTRDLPNQPNVLRTVIGQATNEKPAHSQHSHGHHHHSHHHHDHEHSHD